MTMIKKTATRIMALAMIGILLLTGCSKDNSADLKALLATVPADVNYVAVINMQQLLEEGGCKVKDGAVVIPDKLKGELAQVLPDDMIDTLTTPNGIAYSSFVLFGDENYTYFTVLLDDPATFKALCEKKTNEKFSNEDGLEVCDKIVVKDNQAWMFSGTVIPASVNRFLSLSENQSVLSKSYAPWLQEGDDSMRWVGDVNALLGHTNMRFSQTSMVRLVVNTLFDDAAFVSVCMDVDKKETEVEVKVHDSKFRTAKCLINLDKIDLSTVKDLNCTGNVFMAAGVNKKMVDKITAAVGGMLPRQFSDAFMQLDGTLAAAIGSNRAVRFPVKCVISTKGEASQDLVALSNMMFPASNVTRENGRLVVDRGDLAGKVTSDEAAALFKGAYLGVVVADDKPGDEGFGVASMCLVPDDGGVKMEIKAPTTIGAAKAILQK